MEIFFSYSYAIRFHAAVMLSAFTLSTKCSKRDKIIPNENVKFVSNDDKLCQIFCGYFCNIIFDLQIPSTSTNISNVTDITDPVLAAINMFQDYLSNKNIREKILNQFFLLHTLTK